MTVTWISFKLNSVHIPFTLNVCIFESKQNSDQGNYDVDVNNAQITRIRYIKSTVTVIKEMD